MRREEVKSVRGGVYHLKDTEGYLVEKGREAIEFWGPLMGFNPLGLFPLQRGLVLVAAGNDAQPLDLAAGYENRYRPEVRSTRKELATRLHEVERTAVLIAGQRSERQVIGTTRERIISHVIYGLLALFAVEIFIIVGPRLGEWWESMPW